MATTQSNNRRGRKTFPVTTVGNSVNQEKKKKKQGWKIQHFKEARKHEHGKSARSKARLFQD